MKSLLKQHSDFKLLVADDTLNFTPFKRGTLLSEQPNDSYHVQHEMEWILFPNPRVAMGLRAGIMLVQMDEAELPIA
ncbi:succinylglutamate desuccinylase [Yersinia enterocolitica]|nr:succinylglutamate desuccinylase [Yersinia enterocolitica]